MMEAPTETYLDQAAATAASARFLELVRSLPGSWVRSQFVQGRGVWTARVSDGRRETTGDGPTRASAIDAARAAWEAVG